MDSVAAHSGGSARWLAPWWKELRPRWGTRGIRCARIWRCFRLRWCHDLAALTLDIGRQLDRRILARSKLRTHGNRTITTEGLLMECEQAFAPQEFSGLGTLTVLTIDLSEGLAPADPQGHRVEDLPIAEGLADILEFDHVLLEGIT